MDVNERIRREKAIRERVASGKSKGATFYSGGKEVKIGSHRVQNITQEVRTDGSVVTTTKDSRGKTTSRDVYTPPKTTSKPTTLTQQEISAKILRPKVVDTRTGKVIDQGNFKLDKNFNNRLIAIERANRQQRQRYIDIAKQKLISQGTPPSVANLYNDKQLLQIAASQNISSVNTLEGKLRAIDNRTDLNTLQKNIKKREVLGLSEGAPGDFGKYLEIRKAKINKELSELIKLSPNEAIAKKVLNGESLTPRQQELYMNKVNQDSKDLTKAQAKVILNLPKDVGLGIFEVGQEFVLFGRDVIRGSYRYGVRASEKANREGKSVLSVISGDAKQLLETTALTIGKVSGFILKNPKESVFIVGVAIGDGFKSSEKAFIDNPTKTLTKAILYLFPGTAISGVTKGVKATSKTIKTLYKTIKAKNASQLTRTNKNIAILTQEIEKLEALGVNARQRTKQAQYLRNAKQELKLLQEEKTILSASVKELDEIMKTATKTPIKKPKIKKTDKSIKTTEKKLKAILTKKQKLKKQRTKLKDSTKGKLLGEFFKEKTKKQKTIKRRNPASIKEVTEYNKIKVSIKERLKDLNKKQASPVISEEASKRIAKEIELLQKQFNKIIKDLEGGLETAINPTQYAKKAKESLSLVKDFSLFLEKYQKLRKKASILSKNNITNKRIVTLLNKSKAFFNLSKAQRGQYLKSLDKYIKQGFKTKIQTEKPIKTPTKIIERNKFSKSQIGELLKPVDSKRKLDLKIKDIDKRINALKSQSWTPAQKAKVNPRIKKYEALKTKIREQYKKGEAPLDQKQIQERYNKFSNEIQKNKPKFISAAVTDKSNSIRVKVGKLELEVTLNRQKGLRSSKSGRAQFPVSVRIIKQNYKSQPKIIIDKFKNNVEKAYQRDTKIKRYNKFLDDIRKLDTKTKQYTKLDAKLKQSSQKKLTLKQKQQLKLSSKELMKLEQQAKQLMKIRMQNVLFATLKLQSQLQLKLQLQLQLKLQLKLKQINKLLNKLGFKDDIIKIPKPKKPTAPKPRKPVPRPRKIIKTPKPPKPPAPKPPRPPKPPAPKPPKPPIRPPLIKLNFNNLKNNQVAKFEGVYRERRDRRKVYNPRTNPRVIKKIQLTTTKNRLLKDLTKLVDERPVRSMNIKLVGVTNKVKKDIGKPARLNKFTAKIGKNPKVLNLVEKKKYLIDTPGEKRELKRLKKAKAKKKASTKRVSKVSKVKKTKKSSKKSSK